jgi:hypothetical protein
VGIGLLALRTDTLFTPALKQGPEFLSIYLSICVWGGGINKAQQLSSGM